MKFIQKSDPDFDPGAKNYTIQFTLRELSALRRVAFEGDDVSRNLKVDTTCGSDGSIDRELIRLTLRDLWTTLNKLLAEIKIAVEYDRRKK